MNMIIFDIKNFIWKIVITKYSMWSVKSLASNQFKLDSIKSVILVQFCVYWFCIKPWKSLNLFVFLSPSDLLNTLQIWCKCQLIFQFVWICIHLTNVIKKVTIYNIKWNFRLRKQSFDKEVSSSFEVFGVWLFVTNKRWTVNE